MGLFLETAVIPGRTEAEVRSALEALAGQQTDGTSGVPYAGAKRRRERAV